MAVFDPSGARPRVSHGGTYNGNPVTMVAGYEAMSMLTPGAYDQLNGLGERLRIGLADVIENRGVSWQVGGGGSLFKLHPHPRPLLDYRSSILTPEEEASIEQFYMAVLGQGFVLTPDLAGALSTPMTESHIDGLVEAADRAFAGLDL
jgi:glutamate-1-semialdehyde 2,1-aminomutase